MNIDSIHFAKALADDTRQEIMKILCCRWLSVNEVVEELGGKVNQPTVSHHLKLLAAANLVLTECCGRLLQNFAPEYAGSVIQLYPDGVQ
jgi:DNA-binding transcriptional ArsR family regulator